MTKSQYIQAIQEHIDDTSDRAKAVIQKSFNGAYRQILQRVGRFMLQEETTAENGIAGQNYLEPTNKFTTIINVYIKNGDNFVEIPSTNVLEPNQETATPSRYHVKGDKIYFNTILPTTTLFKIRWTPRPESLGDGDEVLLDDSYDYVLINGAVGRFFQYEGDAGYQDFTMQFKEDLRELALDYSTRQPIVTPKLI